MNFNNKNTPVGEPSLTGGHPWTHAIQHPLVMAGKYEYLREVSSSCLRIL